MKAIQEAIAQPPQSNQCLGCFHRGFLLPMDFNATTPPECIGIVQSAGGWMRLCSTFAVKLSIKIPLMEVPKGEINISL